ncbi:MAG TPA: LacI family DNA-binding transcriptional regulator, partial [Corynebacterium sp.]|nr:LacI family DNA-binding transcriptional regulator [Corynebacterium sp.]
MVKRARTLASLAAELGVSRTTVSNAYNQPDQLSAELRERILRAAAERGYPGPDPMARS